MFTHSILQEVVKIRVEIVNKFPQSPLQKKKKLIIKKNVCCEYLVFNFYIFVNSAPICFGIIQYCRTSFLVTPFLCPFHNK